MGRMREVTLRQLSTDISYGYTASANSDPTCPKFLRITDIVPYRVDWTNVPYCRIPEASIGRYMLQEGDLVIARTGATTGYNFVMDGRYKEPVVFASYLIRYRLDRGAVVPAFLKYVLKSSEWHGYVENIIGGSAQPGANAQQFADFSFMLPPLEEQHQIAEVLSSLDDKIELLQQQNQTLEHMAETLYRQWFEVEAVSFTTLGSILQLNYGKALKEEIREPGPYPVLGSSGVVGCHCAALVQGPGIVIGRKGTLGVVTYVFEDFFPIDTTYYITSKRASRGMYFEYFLLKAMDLEHMNSDSAVPGLNRDIALSSEVAAPRDGYSQRFDNSCAPLFDKMNANKKQILALQQTRDTLLPKLMSGEVRVVAKMEPELV